MTQPDLRSIWAHLDTVAFEQGYVDAGGVRTRFVHAGPKGAPPVVMVHGMGGSWENFIANFGPLSEHFDTYAFDLVGHGYSDKPDRVLDVAAYVEQLAGVLKAFGLKRVNLFGLSVGCWTSTKFAVRYPDSVAKIFAMSAWGRPRGEMTPEMDAKGKQLLAARLSAVDAPTYQKMDEVFSELIADPALRMQDLLALRLRLYQQPGMPQNMRNIFAGISPANWEKNALTDAELKGLSCPFMLVACVDHPDLFLKNAHEYRALVPNLRWVEAKGASHWPQWERADLVNAESIAFFKS